MTLTSMAGIQLADAETNTNNNNNASTMQLQNMSGAMPTATVEEINVPVFIDEYLQDSVDSTPTPSAFFKDIPNDNNNVDGSAKYNGIDQEDYDQETLKDMENYLDQMMSNQTNNSSDSNFNDNNSNMCCTAFSDEEMDSLLDLPVFTQRDADMMDLDYSSGDFSNIEIAEDAVDINAYGNSSLEDCLIHSQEVTPLLSETILINSNSKVITNAEPQLSNCDTTDDCFRNITTSYNNNNNININNSSNVMCINATICESVQVNNLQKLKQKPILPALKINLANSSHNEGGEITTAVILEDFELPYNYNQPRTESEIIEFLQSAEAIKCENDDASNHTNTTDSYLNFSALSSVVSLATSSPNSPALSTSSTLVHNSNSSKRKRGRPPKDHSDVPDYVQLQNMSPEDRKKTQDRAKNNEASRQSRLKKKKEMEKDMLVEAVLEEKNESLKRKLEELKRKEEKLKQELSATLNAS